MLVAKNIVIYFGNLSRIFHQSAIRDILHYSANMGYICTINVLLFAPTCDKQLLSHDGRYNMVYIFREFSYCTSAKRECNKKNREKYITYCTNNHVIISLSYVSCKKHNNLLWKSLIYCTRVQYEIYCTPVQI